MSSLTILVLLGLAIWWYRPLRVFLIQRTNRAVKALLVAFPLLFLVRLGYGLYKGEQADWFVVALTVTGLLLVWVALMWLGSWLERRRPTTARPPDLAALSRLPGMPRLPQLPVVPPPAQHAVQLAARAAASVDWTDVAVSAGRISGRLVARLRRSAGAGRRSPAPDRRPAAPKA